MTQKPMASMFYGGPQNKKETMLLEAKEFKVKKSLHFSFTVLFSSCFQVLVQVQVFRYFS